MVAPNPVPARRRTNSSSSSVAVPSSLEESVVSGAITNRFAISRPQLNRKGDQTTIDQTSDIPKARQAFGIANQILDNRRSLKAIAWRWRAPGSTSRRGFPAQNGSRARFDLSDRHAGDREQPADDHLWGHAVAKEQHA